MKKHSAQKHSAGALGQQALELAGSMPNFGSGWLLLNHTRGVMEVTGFALLLYLKVSEHEVP